MLQKHESQSVIKAIERSQLVGAFKDAMILFRDTKRVYQHLLAYRDGGVDVMELTDLLEDYVDVDCSNLWYFCKCKNSVKPIVNKYLARVLQSMKQYVGSLTMAVDCMFNVGEHEVDALMRQAYDVVSGMTFFCIYEFALLDTLTFKRDEGKDFVDEIVDTYCASTGETPIAVAEEFEEAAHNFQVRFDVFDAFPELEGEFMRIMGPSILGIDAESLTREDVEAVISGDLSPEMLIARIPDSQDEFGEDW